MESSVSIFEVVSVIDNRTSF